MRNRSMFGTAVGMAVCVLTFAGCSSGPSTQTEVCDAYDNLASEAFQGNAGFGNPLFDAAGELGNVAAAYPDSGVQQDGAELKAIADSDSTSVAELESATTSIASLCGGSLMTRAFTGE